jgi:hypothetical protein
MVLLLKDWMSLYFFLLLQHSCYDATVSVQYSTFMQFSLFENPEPDWNEKVVEHCSYPEELHFDLDDQLKQEIKRMEDVGKDTVFFC